MSLDKYTDLIKKKTADIDNLNKKVKFDLTDEGIIHIDATVVPPKVTNEDLDADVTLILSADNFEGLLDGSLNPQMAFMMGKLKIEGQMGLALKLADIFG